MIVIDSSAVIAILRKEDEAAHYARCIAGDDDPIISTANIVETSIVLRSLKKITPDRAERWLDEFIETAGIRIEPVTREQAAIARSVHRRFGKGTGHAAALNYGDCFSYALAKAMNAPLLCKGNDRYWHRLTERFHLRASCYVAKGHVASMVLELVFLVDLAVAPEPARYRLLAAERSRRIRIA